VLHDPARAERVDVDAVDLAARVEAVAELEPALQLRRRALAPEADLEAPGDEPQFRARLVAHESIEVVEQPDAQLGCLRLGELDADAAAQRLVEAAAEELERRVEVLRA